MKESSILSATPALIIGLDQFSKTVLEDVHRIYLRTLSEKEQISRFMMIDITENDPPVRLCALRDLGEHDDQEVQAIETISEKVIDHITKLYASLQQEIFCLKDHDRLLKAGFQWERGIPINIFLLGDCKDAHTRALLLPMLYLCNFLRESSGLIRLHVLLNGAVYPQEDFNQSAEQALTVYGVIESLHQFMAGDLSIPAAIHTQLPLEMKYEHDFPVYLFQASKEGAYVVGDHEKLRTLMGNALLTLLSDDTAGKLFNQQDRYEITETQGYFHSIGANVFLYDPKSFQAACSRKAAREILNTWFLKQREDFKLVSQFTELFKHDIGSNQQWLEKMVRNFPEPFSETWVQAENQRIVVKIHDFVLSQLNYFKIKETNWVEELNKWEVDCRKQIGCEVVEVIKTNSAELQKELMMMLNDSIDEVPSLPNLYPGGVFLGYQLLENICSFFTQEYKQLQSCQDEQNNQQQVLSRSISDHYQQIQQLINKIPNLPWWVKILPKRFKTWIVPIYYPNFHRRRLMQLVETKNEALKAVEENIGFSINTQVNQSVVNLLLELINRCQEAKNQYTEFADKVKGTAVLSQSNDLVYPLGMDDNRWDQFARHPVLDQGFVDWYYQNHKPFFEEWGRDLLLQDQIFSDWQGLEAEKLLQDITFSARSFFSSVWELDLEKILSIKRDHFLGEEDPFSFFREELKKAVKNASPVMLANFDAGRGKRISQIQYGVVGGRPDWECMQFELPETNGLSWQILYSGDPYYLSCYQVRKFVQASELDHTRKFGLKQWTLLNEEGRKPYRLSSFLVKKPKPVPRPAVVPGEEMFTDGDDEVVKEFQWDFQPRGAREPVPLRIQIKMNHQRFEHYRRLPRLQVSEGWNHYAEKEMPEVREIAYEIQKINKEHNWSTMNQAYNVLNFVQKNINYSFDKDSTGHEEWPRYPIETLMEGTGDCEDVAILCAAIIARMGFQVVLLDYPGHMAFGVAGADKLRGEYIQINGTGSKYFYGEATAEGWHLGVIPERYRNQDPEGIFPVNILIDDEEDES